MHDAHALFARLDALLPLDDLLRHGSQRLHSPGFHDLFAEVLTRRGHRLQVSLAHFLIVSGLACPNPEMEIEVDLEVQRVRPLVIQFPSGHQTRAIAFDRQGHEVVNHSVLAELCEFLAAWLDRLIAERYVVRQEPPAGVGKGGRP